MVKRGTSARRGMRVPMRLSFALSVFAALLSVATMVRAEGSKGPELDDSQSLTASTDLSVDIFNYRNETFVWNGKGGVEVYDPDGTMIGAYGSGQAVSPAQNGVYRLDVLEDQFDRDGNGFVILASRVPWEVMVLDKNDDEIKGRLFSREWRFDCGEFKQTSATTGSFYARVPTGDPDNWGVVELRLDGLAGYVFEIWGNHTGVNGPDAGRSVLEENNTVTSEYQMYLNPPDKEGTSYTHLTPEVSGFKFIGGTDAGAAEQLAGCNRIVAGKSEGQFIFETNIQGTFHLICDYNKDGVFNIVDKDDFLILGNAEPGINVVDWDGRDRNGKKFSVADYECRVRVTVGEFHYVGRDIETSFLGMRMYEVDDKDNRRPLNMFWNDELVQDPWAVTMPAPHAYLSAESSGASGLYSGDYADAPIPYGEPPDDSGNTRAWGDFVTFTDTRGEGNGKGNRAFLDTYTWIADKTSKTLEIMVVDGQPDADGDGLPDYVERCVTGTRHDDPDSDGDGVDDNVETEGGKPAIDTDGDGTVDGLDKDDDGDCVPTLLEDPDEDGDPTNDDTDTDGILNYLDEDDDGDTLQSCEEDADGNGDPTNDDTDGDDVVNYLDPDDNDGPLGDLDHDGIVNKDDNCPITANPDQADLDADGEGDVCDDDVDGDGRMNVDDNCYIENRLKVYPDDALTPIDADNADQTDLNQDGVGDACQPDTDGDGWPDPGEKGDNCINDPNLDQDDLDGDDEGDACDKDIDGDGLTNKDEKNIHGTNPFEQDTDGGGVSDGDEVARGSDPLDEVDDPGPRQVSGGGLFKCAAAEGTGNAGFTPLWMLGILIALGRGSNRRNDKRRSNRTEG